MWPTLIRREPSRVNGSLLDGVDPNHLSAQIAGLTFDDSATLRRKLVNIQNTGATIVAMDCPGCAVQIRGGLDKNGRALEVRHTAELIAESVVSCYGQRITDNG